MLPRLVMLDRDGVINDDSPDYIKCPEEWLPIASSLRAIAALNQAGIKVGVASNQRGIGRGLYDEAMLMRITEKMHRECAKVGAHIDAFYYCPALERTHPDHKPNPGMLNALKAEFGIQAGERTYFVGDKLSDVQAALNAGVTPILVTTGYGQSEQAKVLAQHQNVSVYPNLAAFVQALLGKLI
ncbi:D-glycero-beta-D-manno-heptose 1,7-bisphosphate 7-phosphatase [Wohlfahrtiimonas chitiniclastica]|uniref:D-glycero-beta-D-manno-heptose 1,7-bisphosphate 7-phosphatase n=1 Tax=Wohlfahrtiimonas chitiniclastica TaxID=400946 RepID=UPI001BCDA87A|nr:D-glycero-beta-D-manno-heptose 1,7-bisphosphate 7-phosphatase [Wohlfahrtiimonas chitiniclastica]MBS7815365.1 D-glycero-beta-D-manno-heptose 1,7-bisphosphate 7-phosphatase [Wohlfahrtiimonas chitiniclastica]